jgi:hypothetical protein
MAWQKLTTKNASSTVSSLTTDVFTAKKFITILCQYFDNAGANSQADTQVGSTTIDTSTNYSDRQSSNGGADGTNVSATLIDSSRDNLDGFSVGYAINISAEEKLFIFFNVAKAGTGAANAPERQESVGKWVNTSSQFDIYQMQAGARTFISDSNISALGTD